MTGKRRGPALLAAVGAVLAISVAGCQANSPLKLVAVDEAHAALRAGAAALDVRTRDEQAAGVLPQARPLSLEEPAFAERAGTLDPAATYIVYCRTDHRSVEAATTLVDLGSKTSGCSSVGWTPGSRRATHWSPSRSGLTDHATPPSRAGAFP